MSRKLKILLGALFFLSGLSSLAFQAVWVRSLTLTLGSTSESVSIVLAIFFLGLAFGSYIAGALSSRIQRPLRLYGLLEGAVGVYSIICFYVLINLHKVLSMLPLESSLGYLGLLSKVVLVTLVLLPPTMAMGATLPLLAKTARSRFGNSESFISLFYGINTLGASVGALSIGFVFIPQFGVTFSNHLMGLLNLLVCAGALIINKLLSLAKTEDLSPTTELHRSEPASFIPVSTGLNKWVLFALTAICGFASISAEVVWSKYLSIFVGTNIFGLSIVLWVYLFGMAIGSLLLAYLIKKVRNKDALFLGLLIGTAVTTLMATHLINKAPMMTATLAHYTRGILPLLSFKTIVVSSLLLLPTCFYGMLFPLTINILTGQKDELAKNVGRIYAINTIGAILGSCLAGLVLIPAIGSDGTMRVSILVLIAGAALCAYFAKSLGKPRYVGLALAFGLFIFVQQTQQLSFESIIRSAYMTHVDPNTSLSDTLDTFDPSKEDFKLIVEGKSGVISLSQTKQDGPAYQRYLRLKTSGLNESIYSLDYPDMLPKYEALLGLLPYAFAKDPRNAFVVGYGGGYSVDLLSSLPLSKVNVIELEEGIFKAADYVHHGKNPITSRPNVAVRIEDARYVLAAKQGGPYDIIVSQPSHSWLSGVANLFTQEFFEMVKGNLSEGGVYSQWLNLYNMDETVLRSILKTFYTVFPHGAVFTDFGDQEMIMIGSMTPVTFDQARLKAITENESLRRKLYYVPMNAPSDLSSILLTDAGTVRGAVQDAPINTDFNAYAEVRQSRLFYTKRDNDNGLQEFLKQRMREAYAKTEAIAPLRGGDQALDYNVLVSLYSRHAFEKFYALLSQYEATAPKDAVGLQRMGYLALLAQRYDSAERYLRQAMDQGAGSEALNLLLASLQAQSRYRDILAEKEQHDKIMDETSECYTTYAALQLSGLSPANVSEVQKLQQSPTSRQVACGEIYSLVMGYYYHLANDPRSAVRYFDAYLAKYPQHLPSLRLAIANRALMGDDLRVSQLASKLDEARRASMQRLRDLAAYYRMNGFEKDARAIEVSLASIN